MKKTKFIAGLTAVLLAVQAGIQMTVFAGNPDGDLQKIHDFMAEQDFHYVDVVPSSSGNGFVILLQNTPQSDIQKQEILDYCYDQGFFSEYTISLGTEDWAVSAVDVTADILRRYFTDSFSRVTYQICCHEDGTRYLRILKKEDSPEAEEEFQTVLKYCLTRGLTEHCEFMFDRTVPKQELSTEILAGLSDNPEEVLVQIQNFISENQYHATVELRTETNGEYKFYILTQSEEELLPIYSYCREYTAFSDSLYLSTEQNYQIQELFKQIQAFFEEKNYLETLNTTEAFLDSETPGRIIVSCSDEDILQEEIRPFCESLTLPEGCYYEFLVSVTEPAIEPAIPETTEVCSSELTIFAGDVNLDNHVNILDVILLNRAVLGKETLTEIQNLAADINQDKLVDATDSLMILKQIVGMQ